MRNTSGLKRWSLEARYQNYLQKYAKKEAQMMKTYGISMDMAPYSKAQFDAMYQVEASDLKARGKSPTNAVQSLINRQAYKLSQAQAVAQRKSYFEKNPKAKGKAFSVGYFRAQVGKEIVDFQSSITARYHELRDSGMKANVIRQVISREYFGSE